MIVEMNKLQRAGFITALILGVLIVGSHLINHIGLFAGSSKDETRAEFLEFKSKDMIRPLFDYSEKIIAQALEKNSQVLRQHFIGIDPAKLENAEQLLKDLKSALGTHVHTDIIGAHYNVKNTSDNDENLSDSVIKGTFVHHIEFTNGWAKFDHVFEKSGDTFSSKHLSWYALDAPLDKLYSPLNAEFGFTHLIAVIWSIALVSIVFSALYICLRSNHRFKPLWVLAIGLPLKSAAFNWSTGDFANRIIYTTDEGVQKYSMMFRTIGFEAEWPSIYGPMTISLGLPIGAVVFLIFWWSKRGFSDGFDNKVLAETFD
jgi:hypothetical protein